MNNTHIENIEEKENSHLSPNDSSDSDLVSLIDGKIQLKLRNKEVNTNSISSIEISNTKNASTVFFILFLIITAIVSFSSASNIMKKESNITKKLNFQKLLSYYFSYQPLFIKGIIILSQTIFLFLCGFLFNLQKQRMNVPEYYNSKYKTYLFLICSSLSSILFITNLFFFDPLISISQTIGIHESFVFFFFILFSFGTCYFSYDILKNLVLNEEIDTYMSNVLYFKKLNLFALLINFMIYSLTLVLIQFPLNNDIQNTYKILFILSIMSTGLFLVTFSLFIFSFRFDINFIYSILNVQPDIEYFIEDNRSS